ncbi:hypothetical protein GOBAR_DD10611 [Gossypium barbadense]|nr:hypothetical protein GOBAR_DD10611 [Gossypium barbadense]
MGRPGYVFKWLRVMYRVCPSDREAVHDNCFTTFSTFQLLPDFLDDWLTANNAAGFGDILQDRGGNFLAARTWRSDEGLEAIPLPPYSVVGCLYHQGQGSFGPCVDCPRQKSGD